MENIKLIIENLDTIIMAIGTVMSGIVGVLTVANQLMPKVIDNKTLAVFEADTSKFSIGSKKAIIAIKKIEKPVKS